ncbi:MAG: LysM peptidoglycan-binding domain-containing protein [Bacteroidia bacterium]|nr:LysM peptidoglycan-binding domain-containing protein [Bacteroidia bacterium]
MAFAAGLLGKMKLAFYTQLESGAIIPIPFPLQYNPSTFNVTHGSCYDATKLPLYGDKSKKFLSVRPRTLTMDLNFDGTGASPSNFGSIIPPGVNLVDVQVKAFLTLAMDIQGPLHEPFNIVVVWGTFLMKGIVKSAVVTYNFFDRDGRPLRAKIAVTVEERLSHKKAVEEVGPQSADLTKSITVVDGDTLPNLCEATYGNAALYLEIARVNHLDNYRKLKPGMQLVFPPIVQTT